MVILSCAPGEAEGQVRNQAPSAEWGGADVGMGGAPAAEQVLWCPSWGGEQVSLQGNGEPNNVGASIHLPVWAGGFYAWEMGCTELFNPSTSSPSEQGQAPASLSLGRAEGKGRDAGADALTLTAAAF